MSLLLRSYPLPADHSTPARCLRCRAVLEIHQPDVNTPDRLLGICPDPDCGGWHLLDETEAVLVLLPDRWASQEAPMTV